MTTESLARRFPLWVLVKSACLVSRSTMLGPLRSEDSSHLRADRNKIKIPYVFGRDGRSLYRWQSLGYNRSVPQGQAKRIQEELEKAVQALKVTADPDERKALLRKMRRLIEEADHLTSES
jgi:hypothetical protein